MEELAMELIRQDYSPEEAQAMLNEFYAMDDVSQNECNNYD